MKIKKRNKIVVTEYTLNEEDARIVRICLNYCWHRLAKHGGSGLQGILGIRELDKIRNKIRKGFGIHTIKAFEV